MARNRNAIVISSYENKKGVKGTSITLTQEGVELVLANELDLHTALRGYVADKQGQEQNA